MRANAIEKLLSELVDAVQAGHTERVENYCTKANILLDRNSTESASVVRELMNEGN